MKFKLLFRLSKHIKYKDTEPKKDIEARENESCLPCRSHDRSGRDKQSSIQINCDSIDRVFVEGGGGEKSE